MINRLILKSRAGKWDVAKLSRLLKAVHIAKRTLQTGIFIVVITTMVQLAYPQNRPRPLLKMAGQPIGFWTQEKLASSLQSASLSPYQLIISQKSYNLKPKELGIVPQVPATVDVATSYSWRQRLTPFTIFNRTNLSIKRSVDEAKLAERLDLFAKQRNQQPVNSVLQKINGDYGVAAIGRTGYKVNQEALKQQILRSKLGSRLVVPRTPVKPQISQAMLQAAMINWQLQTNQDLTLNAAGRKVVVPAEILKEWVQISANQEQSAVVLSYDNSAIGRWLSANLADSLYVAPKSATSYLRDNVVTSTSTGVNGKALDVTKTIEQLTSSLKSGARQADVVTSVVAYKTSQVASYSPTSRGLQLLINSWAEKRSAAVSFVEIGGQGRAAGINQSQQFFAASIYKLYMAHYTYDLIESGKLSPNASVLSSDQTVGGCLEKMIVVSDNDCPLKFANQFGWATVDSFTKQHGFSNTSIIATKTTTADTAKFLDQLQAGNLLNPSDTGSLMGFMGRQIFRQAIPAGSPGATVYDKVGNYNGYWHDAAIVRSPHANYILVVFTSRGGPTPIKSLASQIQQTLAQAN